MRCLEFENARDTLTCYMANGWAQVIENNTRSFQHIEQQLVIKRMLFVSLPLLTTVSVACKKDESFQNIR